MSALPPLQPLKECPNPFAKLQARTGDSDELNRVQDNVKAAFDAAARCTFGLVSVSSARSVITGTAPIIVSAAPNQVVSHADSGVTPGTFNSLTVDAKGHVTAASTVAVGTVIDITAGAGISVGGTAPHPTVANTGILAVSVTAPIHSTGGQSPTLSHDTSGVAAGTYNSLTVDTKGHVTAASVVSVGTVSSIIGTAPIHVVGGAGPTATVSHDASGVSAGLFNNVTVDAKGHVTDGVIVPDPYILSLTYGPLGNGPPNAIGSDGTLPILPGGEGTPIFWLRPSTDIKNVSAVGTVSDQFIVEWPVDDNYARAILSVYVRNLSLSATVGLVTMTMVITKNGTATATGIAFPASETDTLHTSTQFVSFAPGDLVGVRVSFSSNYASGTMILTARAKLT